MTSELRFARAISIFLACVVGAVGVFLAAASAVSGDPHFFTAFLMLVAAIVLFAAAWAVALSPFALVLSILGRLAERAKRRRRHDAWRDV